MANKWFKKQDVPEHISEIVKERTGMSEQELLNDVKVYHINNMQEATVIFTNAAIKREIIVFHTDYDGDGINCANIARNLASILGITDSVKVVVPRRFSDGYGVQVRHVEAYAEWGCKVLILADNGIAAIEPVKRAKELGMKVIILDHHEKFVNDQKEVVLPDADVLCDPHVTGADFVDYCGAGLMYIFANSIVSTCPWLSDGAKEKFHAVTSVYAAIGTIADVVSLTGENRRIVKAGIKNALAGRASTGMMELLKDANMLDRITAPQMAFFLCPMFNAYGRLDDGGSAEVSDATSYMGVHDESIENNCQTIKDKNEERKKLAEEAFARAVDYINANNLQNERFIVFVDEDGSAGINGLTAGKLTEKYRRPSIVVSPTIDDNILKGSGRSRYWANLKEILDQSNEFIEKYGGHPGACGITLTRDKINDFIKAVNDLTPEAPAEEQSDIILYDKECRIVNLRKMFEETEKYQPFGEGNPEIVFRIDDIDIVGKKRYRAEGVDYYQFMGANKQHVKLFANGFQLIWFGGAEEYKKMGCPLKVSVLGTLNENIYVPDREAIPRKEYRTLQVQVTDLKPADAGDKSEWQNIPDAIADLM
jgi:single-stranded DNA-specific exonuclease